MSPSVSGGAKTPLTEDSDLLWSNRDEDYASVLALKGAGWFFGVLYKSSSERESAICAALYLRDSIAEKAISRR